MVNFICCAQGKANFQEHQIFLHEIPITMGNWVPMHSPRPKFSL